MMRLALLVCDHVATPLAAVHGDYPFMFQRLLGLKLETYFVCDNQFPAIHEYDAFVVTGSKKSVYEVDEWIKNLLIFTQDVAKTNKKYVGICFGHQVIGEALGGKVSRSDEGYLIGIHENRITDEGAWMHPTAQEFNILMLCQDQISRLPENTKVHATSPRCNHAMISINDQFLGIQGHPEFTRSYNQDVFISRKEKIGDARVQEAVASLTKEPHTELLATWIRNFLQS